MAQMSSASINDLPDSAFAYIEPGGSKDSSGRTVPRSLRHFPVHDEAHVRNALSRAPQSPFGDKAMPKIRSAAKKYGIDTGGDSGSRAEALELTQYPQMVIHRTVPLEDISIKPGDGRTVEAYLAVFDTEAEIRDPQGHYKETIDRSAFNDAIYTARPQGSRTSWKTSVYYNHAMTPYGTPSERWSAPVAVTQDLIVESRGVRAIDRYAATPDGDYALELVRNGAVKGYSFTGALKRSDPMRPPTGGFRPRNGVLPVVRRLVLGLSEYGPTPEPAYETAGVVGMRADLARRLVAAGFSPEELAQLVRSTPDGETDEDIDTSHREDVTDERPVAHSVRQSPLARRLSVALTARGMRSDDEAAGHPRPADGDPRRTA